MGPIKGLASALCLGAAAMLAAAAGPSSAEDGGAGKAAIGRDIRLLGSADPAQRERAREGLLGAGAAAFRELCRLETFENPEQEMNVRMLVFRMEPYYGPWTSGMEAGRFLMNRGDFERALAMFLSAAGRHEPIRGDKWFRHLVSSCYARVPEDRREAIPLEDWGLYATGQIGKLVATHKSSKYRERSLFELGMYDELLAEFPKGEFAPYAKYSKVSGHAYLEPQAYLEITDPEKEIAEWPGFIAGNKGHPGQDDAAYRLGRACEMAGRRLEAVKWLHLARVLPDGEFRIKGAMRMLYVLDSLCTLEELESLSKGAPSPEIEEWAQVSIAVRHFRAFRFGESLASWKAYLQSRPKGRFAEHAAARAELIEKRILPLAAAAEDGRAGDAALYEIGRIFYHDVLANYNPAWEGSRAEYLSTEINCLGRTHAFDNPAYFESHNNYLAAAAWFAKLLGRFPESPLKDKALYSTGSCWLKAPMLNHFSNFSLSRREMLAKAREYYRRVVDECPDSPLLGDAARMIAVIELLPPDWMQY